MGEYKIQGEKNSSVVRVEMGILCNILDRKMKQKEVITVNEE